MPSSFLWGFRLRFQSVSPGYGQVIDVLLSRSPLNLQDVPFDLHVLGMPPAFILSQDQTLHLILTKTLLRFDFVLRQAMHHRLGELLTHQLTNEPQIHPSPRQKPVSKEEDAFFFPMGF